MKRKTTFFIATVFMFATISLASSLILSDTNVSAEPAKPKGGSKPGGGGAAGGVNPGAQLEKGFTDAGGNMASDNNVPKQIKNVINVLLYIIAAVSVIMIIVGGIRYVTSNGDQTRITAAKNTIMYAVGGLVVALLAFAIVQFTINAFK